MKIRVTNLDTLRRTCLVSYEPSWLLALFGWPVAEIHVTGAQSPHGGLDWYREDTWRDRLVRCDDETARAIDTEFALASMRSFRLARSEYREIGTQVRP